ncbi:hypothetical protein LXL04_007772 [Taraxacum kok-saghyz]
MNRKHKNKRDMLDKQKVKQKAQNQWGDCWVLICGLGFLYTQGGESLELNGKPIYIISMLKARGLPESFLAVLRDARNRNWKQSLMGIIESSLSHGPNSLNSSYNGLPGIGSDWLLEEDPGLPESFLAVLRDARNRNWKQSLMGIIEYSLSHGPPSDHGQFRDGETQTRASHRTVRDPKDFLAPGISSCSVFTSMEPLPFLITL